MIRVLRLIEYTYPDAETAERDMSHWLSPAIGVRTYRKGTTFRSTILTDLNYEGEEENETESEQPGS